MPQTREYAEWARNSPKLISIAIYTQFQWVDHASPLETANCVCFSYRSRSVEIEDLSRGQVSYVKVFRGGIMSFIIMLAMWMNHGLAEEPAQCTPQLSCQCGPSSTVDGWQIYLVESCGLKERWLPPDQNSGQYSDQFECVEAIKDQPRC